MAIIEYLVRSIAEAISLEHLLPILVAGAVYRLIRIYLTYRTVRGGKYDEVVITNKQIVLRRSPKYRQENTKPYEENKEQPTGQNAFSDSERTYN